MSHRRTRREYEDEEDGELETTVSRIRKRSKRSTELSSSGWVPADPDRRERGTPSMVLRSSSRYGSSSGRVTADPDRRELRSRRVTPLYGPDDLDKMEIERKGLKKLIEGDRHIIVPFVPGASTSRHKTSIADFLDRKYHYTPHVDLSPSYMPIVRSYVPSTSAPFADISFWCSTTDWDPTKEVSLPAYKGKSLIFRHMLLVPFREVVRKTGEAVFTFDEECYGLMYRLPTEETSGSEYRKQPAYSAALWPSSEETVPDTTVPCPQIKFPEFDYPIEKEYILPVSIRDASPRYLVDTIFKVYFSPAYENERRLHMRNSANQQSCLCACVIFCDDCDEHKVKIVLDCGDLYHFECFLKYRNTEAIVEDERGNVKIDYPKLCAYCRTENKEAIIMEAQSTLPSKRF